MIDDRQIKDCHRFQLCIPAVVLPLFIPIILLLIWHVQNHRWPNDDAANYATTAYEIFDRFQSRGVYEGLLGDCVICVDGVQSCSRPCWFPICWCSKATYPLRSAECCGRSIAY